MTEFMLSIPRTPAPQTMTIKPASVVAVSESPFTYKQQVQEGRGQRWAVEITLPPMVRGQAEPWFALFMRLNGRAGTFVMGDVDGAVPRGLASGSPVVAGAGQSGNALQTSGWSAGVSGVLLAGDWVQLGNRLHKVMADVDSDANGGAVLPLWPRLRESPADAMPLILENTVGVWRLDAWPEWPSDENNLYALTFNASEVV